MLEEYAITCQKYNTITQNINNLTEEINTIETKIINQQAIQEIEEKNNKKNYVNVNINISKIIKYFLTSLILIMPFFILLLKKLMISLILSTSSSITINIAIIRINALIRNRNQNNNTIQYVDLSSDQELLDQKKQTKEDLIIEKIILKEHITKICNQIDNTFTNTVFLKENINKDVKKKVKKYGN